MSSNAYSPISRSSLLLSECPDLLLTLINFLLRGCKKWVSEWAGCNDKVWGKKPDMGFRKSKSYTALPPPLITETVICHTVAHTAPPSKSKSDLPRSQNQRNYTQSPHSVRGSVVKAAAQTEIE